MTLPTANAGDCGVRLHVEAAPSFEATGLAPVEWDGFVERCGSDFCFSHDWCKNWWSHYGNGRILRVLELRADGSLVGLIPMFIDWAGPPGLRMRIGKLIGSDSTIAILVPPIINGYHERVASAVISHMVEAERCDAVWFGPLTGEPPFTEAFRAACGSHPSVDLLHDASPGVHTIFQMPTDFDEYLRSLEKWPRDHYKRYSKQLQKRFQTAFEVVDDPEAAGAAFEEFAELHARQWSAENKPGHFGDWPASKQFTRDLIKDSSPQRRAIFTHIRANDRVIARMHMFRFGTSLHYRLPAREVGAEWDKLSLGNTALVKMLEYAAQEGLTRVEGGPGHYDQKLRYGAREFAIGSILVVRKGTAARLKGWLFCKWSEFVHLAYYRVWRLRVSPHLPLRQGMLSKIWIRSRL